MPAMKTLVVGLLSVSIPFVTAATLDVSNADSIKSVASTVALGLIKWYTGNVTNTPETIGVLPKPYYWWEAGAMWGAFLDYYHYTGDSTYNPTVTQALLSQVGPNYDYMNPVHYDSEGNDDQAFWGFAAMTAAENNYPAPPLPIPSWLQLTINLWNTQVPRWDTTSCGGGLKWQIFSSLNGYHYKNAVSNAAFFQLSARLARYTGNSTYVDWAIKSWDWTQAIGFIDASTYSVYDGASDLTDCKEIDVILWSYNAGIFMYGAAIMYNISSSQADQNMWADRVSGLLSRAQTVFFRPDANGVNIMFEQACESVDTCNNDQRSFKGFLSRFMWKSAWMMPSIRPQIQTIMEVSAQAAVTSCMGSGIKFVCGSKWYVGGYDGVTGPGQMLAALETVQGLLSGAASAPLSANDVQDVVAIASRPAASTSSAADQTAAVVSTSSVAPLPATTTATIPASTSAASSPLTLTSSSSIFVPSRSILASSNSTSEFPATRSVATRSSAPTQTSISASTTTFSPSPSSPISAPAVRSPCLTISSSFSSLYPSSKTLTPTAPGTRAPTSSRTPYNTTNSTNSQRPSITSSSPPITAVAPLASMARATSLHPTSLLAAILGAAFVLVQRLGGI